MQTQTATTLAKQIKLVILDVDGILTDGRLTFTDTGQELKTFHVHDGLGLKMLMQAGIAVAVISSRTSPIVAQRMAELGITDVYQGHEHKLAAFNACLEAHNVAAEQVAYMGDDLVDLAVIQRAGLRLTVPNAVQLIQARCHWQSQHPGGQGAVREACEFILAAQNKLDMVLERFA